MKAKRMRQSEEVIEYQEEALGGPREFYEYFMEPFMDEYPELMDRVRDKTFTDKDLETIGRYLVSQESECNTASLGVAVCLYNEAPCLTLAYQHAREVIQQMLKNQFTYMDVKEFQSFCETLGGNIIKTSEAYTEFKAYVDFMESYRVGAHPGLFAETMSQRPS
jgi:hypothetical protein